MKIQTTKGFGLNRLKFIIHGPAGVGKTTLAGTTGEPTCIISAESGLLSLASANVDFIDISTDDDGNKIPTNKRWDRFKDALKFLSSPEARAKYKWLYIDSATEVSQNLLEALTQKYPDKKDNFPKWAEYGDTFRAMIKFARDIEEYNVVFTALSSTDKDENQRRYTSLDVQGKIGDQIPGYVDLVAYMFELQDEQGNKKRMLRFSGADNIVCKDRSGKLDELEEPNLANIVKKIVGTKALVTVKPTKKAGDLDV